MTLRGGELFPGDPFVSSKISSKKNPEILGKPSESFEPQMGSGLLGFFKPDLIGLSIFGRTLHET